MVFSYVSPIYKVVDSALKRLPIIPEGLRPKYKVLKSITPSNTELDKNNRARSAKLRIIERVSE